MRLVEVPSWERRAWRAAPVRGRLLHQVRWAVLLCVLVAQYVLGDVSHLERGEVPPESSYKCIDDPSGNDDHRVCFFYDVFFWQGTLFYLSNDTTIQLPKVSTRFGVNTEVTGWIRPVAVNPEEVRLDLAPIIEYGEDTDVYLWSTVPENNWFHQAGEYMPTLSNTLCKFLGRCSYNDTKNLVLMELFPTAERVTWAPWLEELDMCFSERPRIALAHSSIYDKVVYVRRALVGVGPECRARLFCTGDPNFQGRRPVPPDMLKLHRRRMADCLGYDDQRSAAVEPKINLVVIDRHYTSSRHILNMGQIMELLQERYGALANITLHYMEGATAADQARLWSSADIVVHMHGAAQGSWMFLPRHAVVVHIVQHPGGVLHDNSYADQWVSDLREVTNISYFPVNNLDMAYAHLKQEVVWKHRQWQDLSTEDKMRLIETGNCEFLGDKKYPSQLRHHCLMWWMHKNLNLVLRPELLLPQVDAAVLELFAKLGKAPPPGFPPPPYEEKQHGREFVGGAGSISRRLLQEWVGRKGGWGHGGGSWWGGRGGGR